VVEHESHVLLFFIAVGGLLAFPAAGTRLVLRRDNA
jgi:hypothetical protein